MLTMGNFLLVLSECVRAKSIARSHDEDVMNVGLGAAILRVAKAHWQGRERNLSVCFTEAPAWETAAVVFGENALRCAKLSIFFQLVESHVREAHPAESDKKTVRRQRRRRRNARCSKRRLR
jgi:hypothetical protein